MGGYRLDEGRLSFEALVSTRMACEPAVMDAEDDYLRALGRTARLSLADDELALLDEAGTELL